MKTGPHNTHIQMQQRLRGEHPRLLLHACCAPCASHVLSEVLPLCRMGVYFYNPNIYPAPEYSLRRSELARLLTLVPGGLAAPLLTESYRFEDFMAVARGLEKEPEGGRRCEACLRLRLLETARQAAKEGYGLFATTLTVSPHKNAPLINALGKEAAAEHGVDYLASDFKKQNGYAHSISLSRAFGLYRQDFCGCPFSRAGKECPHS